MAHLYLLFGRRQKVSKAAVRLHNLCDNEIYQTTRFPRAAVQELCKFVREDVVRPTQRSNAIPVDTQMLAALQLSDLTPFPLTLRCWQRYNFMHPEVSSGSSGAAVDCRSRQSACQ